jgi:hypothetical protein
MKARVHVLLLAIPLVVLTTGCRSKTPEASREPLAGRVPAHLDSGPSASGQGPGVEACLDGWLRERKLDPYGHPEGTMYTGGTPLFDERTGERKDRVAYVLEGHPEARRACADGGS